MTRDEMLTVLRQLEEEFYDDANAAHEDGDRHYNDKARRWGDALHKAVQLLTPLSTEEIGWLRQMVASSRRCVAVKIRGEKDPPWVMRHGLERALDALAREPKLLEQLHAAEVTVRCAGEPCMEAHQVLLNGSVTETIAALESALALAAAETAARAVRIAALEARERCVREASHSLEVAVGWAGMPADSREAINHAIDAVNDAFLDAKEPA